MFQSPQWGSNSKGDVRTVLHLLVEFQSPQWGSNSKGFSRQWGTFRVPFQSPQWGSNSKVELNAMKFDELVSVPAMGK